MAKFFVETAYVVAMTIEVVADDPETAAEIAAELRLNAQQIPHATLRASVEMLDDGEPLAQRVYAIVPHPLDEDEEMTLADACDAWSEADALHRNWSL